MANKTILCIGGGYVGGPTMAMIARECSEYEVIVADINAERIEAWNSGEAPIFEPGIDDLLNESLNRNLFFYTDIPAAIREADVIFVSVNTPTKSFGEGAGMAADLQYWEKTARQIKNHADTHKIVVEKSTVPVRTSQAMERILNSDCEGIQFEVVSNPEFLAEGRAIEDLYRPARVLIGGKDTEAGQKSVEEIAAIYRHWVPEEKILRTSTWSSELSKLASNALLAQRVSSMNAIASFAEETEADVTEVSQAVGMDERIGPKFLSAGVGFGGSCFKKDILNLVYLCQYFGLYEVAEYWYNVVKINSYQKKRFVSRVVENMFNTVVDKKLAVFGFAFKPNTGDIRESPAIDIARQLLEEKARLAITDPEALENARAVLADHKGSVDFDTDPYSAVEGADALLLLTEWGEFRDLDYEHIFQGMRKPAFVFDGRNLLDHQELYNIGFNVFPVGRPPLTHI